MNEFLIYPQYHLLTYYDTIPAMVQVNCGRCDKEFYVKPSHKALGFGKYCSRACAHESARKGGYKNCDLCSKSSYKTKKQLKGTKSGKFFCSKSCQTKWRNSVFIGSKHGNYTNGMHSYRSAMKRYGFKKECKLCSTTDERVLAVHHKDRNRKNNKKENLAWLCHNCHFLVHHYNEGADQGLIKPRS